jgi:glycosyltransferase involved in cell wall biosynthesis
VFLDFSDSNKNKFDYYIKKFFLRRAIKKSKLIFTVSKFTKSRICKHFKNTKDIVVTGNAIANTLKQYKPCTEKREKTLIYVGNIKKHKGLKVLFNALDILNSNVGGYKLVIAGSKDNFRTSDNSVFEYFDRDDVRFTGYLNDEELVREISSATFLIQPSFYEGFCLAPLEALYYSTKPIISDIEVFSEVYSQFDDVVFFESNNPDSLAQKIIDSNPDVLISQKKIDSIFNYKNFTDIIFNELRGVKN